MLDCVTVHCNCKQAVEISERKKSVLIQKEASPFQLHIHLSVPINDIIISDFERTDVF